MAAQCVGEHRALPDQQVPRTVKHEDRLLFGALHRNEAHGRPRDRLADRLRIGGIVLPAFDVGLHVGWRHELHFMTKPSQLPSPMMSRSTGLHPNETGRKRREECQNVNATELLPDNAPSLGVHAVDLKDVLREIESDCGNLHGGWLP